MMNDRPDLAVHYYEAHVTIEPIFDELLATAKVISARSKFRVASLLMKKREQDTGTRSKYDTFMTGHGTSYQVLQARTMNLVQDLQAGFKVWRYKIEDTMMDSRILPQAPEIYSVYRKAGYREACQEWLAQAANGRIWVKYVSELMVPN